MAKFIALTGVDGIRDHVNIDLIAYFHLLERETLVAFAAGKHDKFLGLRVLETPDQINELIQTAASPSRPPRKTTKTPA
jgi:hypothetical protein